MTKFDKESFGLPGYDHRDRAKGEIKYNRWFPDQDEDGRYLRNGRRFDHADGEAWFAGAIVVAIVVFALITWIFSLFNATWIWGLIVVWSFVGLVMYIVIMAIIENTNWYKKRKK